MLSAVASSSVAPELVIVKVSLEPLLFSVSDMPVPATIFPFKNPAVLSFELTKTLTSVSATIADQAEPL